jgi:hypothetical protein
MTNHRGGYAGSAYIEQELRRMKKAGSAFIGADTAVMEADRRASCNH